MTFDLVLVLAHAAVGLVLSGSAGHLAWLSSSGQPREATAARRTRHLQLIGVGLVAALALGLLAYPHFRVGVRAAYLDRAAPWATELFELKEVAGALCIPLWFASRATKGARPLELLLSAAVLFTALSGLIVTAVRGP
ncbi:MAG: hypothetical protein QM723_13085 [Myxococcaceae bacterium]